MLYSPGAAPSGPALAAGSDLVGAPFARFFGRPSATSSRFLLAAAILEAPRRAPLALPSAPRATGSARAADCRGFRPSVGPVRLR